MTDTLHSGVTAGGAAGQAGADFQNRVGAWLAVRILGEQGAQAPWELPANVTLEFLRAESENPVDDLMVGTSAGGHVFIQAKHSLRLGAKDKGLTSAIDQFVRQFLVWHETDESATAGIERRELAQHRLVLATGPTSPSSIRHDLPGALDRVRGNVPGGAVDVVMNADERRAYEVVRNHIETAWVRHRGERPTDDEVHQLMKLIRVHILDVDRAGPDELAAKDLLRGAVLRDPAQANAAWNTLITECASFARTRTGGNRRALQQALLEVGVDLRAPSSYQDDIERLERFSRTMLETLQDHARIRVGSQEVRIARSSTSALRAEAEEGSLLVVSEPGAGKSGALHDVVAALSAAERDVVLLAADAIQAESLGQLRHDIGSSQDLADVLANWPGRQPAFLVIDALDAARGDRAAKAMRDLIAAILRGNDRWHVIASIRKFDLRYSIELQQLFRGGHSAIFNDPEFSGVRHVNVPLLTDDELALVGDGLPGLAQLLATADDVLRELLRVPFNLRLAAELIDSGLEPADLTPIRTQLELLDRYWERRVVQGDREGDAREAVLRRVAEEMVRTRRLRADRTQVADPASSTALNDILSSQVLIEGRPSPTAAPSRYVLMFAHHVLFDYAVARLLLGPKTAEEQAHLLADESDLVVAIRPSLTFHFQRLWEDDVTRTHFWSIVLDMVRAEGVPEIGKLSGPTVAAEAAIRVADLWPLVDALGQPAEQTRSVAARTLRHLSNALLAVPHPAKALVGKQAGPWFELVDRLSQELTPPVVAALRPLLPELYGRPESFTDGQCAALGRAARRLLVYARDHEPRDHWLVTTAMKAVCRTFASAPLESARLIRTSLAPERLAEYGYEEMPKLAEEVGGLIALDPGLVEDIYRACFSHVETSRSKTQAGGLILALSSNRVQDYDMALFVLSEAYPDFLSRAPVEALRALDAIINRYLGQQTWAGRVPHAVSFFDFHGEQAGVQYDQSEWWDGQEPINHRDPNEQLNALQTHLERLTAGIERIKDRSAFLRAVAAETRPASVWRRLLTAGAAHPSTLGRDLRPLAWAMPILLGAATTEPACAFLCAIFTDLIAEERQRVEKTIVGIPDEVPDGRRKDGQKVRDRLLGCLPEDALMTAGAKQLVADLTGDTVGSTHAASLDQALPDEIAQALILTTGEAQEPKGLDHRVLEQVQSWVESADPSFGSDQAAEVETELTLLRNALSGAEAEGHSVRRLREAWARLAEACRLLAWSPRVDCQDSLGALVRSLLLEAATIPVGDEAPGPDEWYDREHPMRPASNPRAEAAAGLVWLASRPSRGDRAVADAVEQLAADPDPGVRLGIAAGVHALTAIAPDVMWRVLEGFCREEERLGILYPVVGSLRRVAEAAPNRAAALTSSVLDRATTEEADFVRRACIGLFVDLYLRFDESVSRKALYEVVSEPASHASEIGRIVRELRQQGGLVAGAVAPSEPAQEAVRSRAFALLDRILDSVSEAYAELLEAIRREHGCEDTENERQPFQNLLEIGHAVAMELYIASGAHGERHRSDKSDRLILSPDVKRRFLSEAGRALDALAEFGHPQVAHPLLQMLEVYVCLDPIGVFLRVARALAVSREFGYQYEELASDLVVGLVERFLADYPLELRENAACRRALIEILDTFTEVGWPSALRLTYHLEQIYR